MFIVNDVMAEFVGLIALCGEEWSSHQGPEMRYVTFYDDDDDDDDDDDHDSDDDHDNDVDDNDNDHDDDSLYCKTIAVNDYGWHS